MKKIKKILILCAILTLCVVSKVQAQTDSLFNSSSIRTLATDSLGIDSVLHNGYLVKLLQKIEELTLYVIRIEKELQQTKTQVQQQTKGELK